MCAHVCGVLRIQTAGGGLEVDYRFDSRHRAAHLRYCLGRLIAETSTASRVLLQPNVVRSRRRNPPEATVAEAQLACRTVDRQVARLGVRGGEGLHFVPGHPGIVDFAYL